MRPWLVSGDSTQISTHQGDSRHTAEKASSRISNFLGLKVGSVKARSHMRLICYSFRSDEDVCGLCVADSVYVV